MQQVMSNQSKRILFVEPQGSKENVFARWMNMPLLGPIYLATILKKQGHDIRVHNENLSGRISKQELSSDILCLTGLTSTIERAYQIAEEFRAVNPDGRIIIGGIHVSFNKEEAAKYADTVVIGEGENVIIDAIENKPQQKFVYADKQTDISELPAPDFSVLNDYKRMRLIPIMTSRGCPFACNFCSVTAMFGRQYRTNSEENVIREMRMIKTRSIFIYDDNFCANKERSHKLLDLMKREDFRFKWSAQVRCDAARDEQLIKKMAETNCQSVCIGFESVNSKTLAQYNKAQTLNDIKLAIKRFHDYGIRIHGMFIFGSDEDDKSVFKQTNDFCNRHDIDSVQYSVLVPLPGTSLFQNLEAQNRLLHKKWRFYDGMHVVFKPKNFTPSELQESAIDCYKDFYTYTKALNGAINIVYDKSINLFRESKSKLNRYFSKNWDTTLLGKLIIRKWLKQNKGYLKYLQNRPG